MAKQPKCEYCGVNMNANCHAHKTYCPYSCKEEQPNPNPKPTGTLDIGVGEALLFGFVILFIGYKILKRMRR